MWLFTKEGFFSVVKNEGADEDEVLIRARVDEDLTRLIEFIGRDIGDEFKDFYRWEDTYSDYRYRLVVRREVFARYMSEAVMDIDYTNVKDSIDQDSEERHSAMMQVWGAMMTLQPDGGWSGYKNDRESGLFEEVHDLEGEADITVDPVTGEVEIVFPTDDISEVIGYADETEVNVDEDEEPVR